MTAARRKRKPPGPLAPVLMVLFLAAATSPAAAQTTEQIVVDRHSGLALYGFDPVAYFTDGKASRGRGDFEYPFAGAVWRFRNEGNRAAFAERPDVYMPKFGGYDPLALARGVATPGHPEVWALADGHVYLFQNPDSRTAFRTDPPTAVEAAEARWPEVSRELLP
jgi:hypothetical protein